jgi:hypothetical protein
LYSVLCLLVGRDVRCDNGCMSSDPSLSDDASVADAEKRGLGDLAEQFFHSLGITEERYKAVKVAMYLDPKCNCADRRRWLNEVGKELGVDGVVLKLAKWMDRRKK